MKTVKALGFYISVTMVMLSCKTETPYDSIFGTFEDANEPILFAPELALKGNTFKGCFSSEYSTFYFFRQNTPDQEDYRIFQSDFIDKKWSLPTEISISNMNSDLYPLVSVIDTNKLYFISYRRTLTDTSKKPNANFWFTTRRYNTWENPTPFVQADLIYNYNSQPCMTGNGNIYFTSDTPDWSQTLTYKMEYKDGVYRKPVLFDFVNELRSSDTTRTYWEICVSPNEEYMVMTISERGKAAKLYLSSKNQEIWTTPIYIGDIIKADMSGNFPHITKDGRFLIFTREFSAFYILPTKTFVKGGA